MLMCFKMVQLSNVVFYSVGYDNVFVSGFACDNPFFFYCYIKIIFVLSQFSSLIVTNITIKLIIEDESIISFHQT